jgi:hypothetical protein
MRKRNSRAILSCQRQAMESAWQWLSPPPLNTPLHSHGGKDNAHAILMTLKGCPTKRLGEHVGRHVLGVNVRDVNGADFNSFRDSALIV